MTATHWWAASAEEIPPDALLLPPGFAFGAATSAHQVEGGTTANNWTRWERCGRPDGGPAILTGECCGRAADHWRRFPADLDLMRWLGLDVYRFSVEWSRIEPVPGYYDPTALDHYRDWCVRLREAGIAPLVTLHHFTEPWWIAEQGSFENVATAKAWLRFVERVVAHLGDVVQDWATINEPVAYAVQGWWRGVWPPGRTEPAVAVLVMENLLLAHARAYRAIHHWYAERGVAGCRVGIAHNIVVFRPRRRANPLDRLAAHMLDATYNRAALRALATGRLRLRLPGVDHSARHDSLRGTQDYLGLNYYHPLHASLRPFSAQRIEIDFPPEGDRNDLGWTLEPASLVAALRILAGYGLPILITEHGTCDAASPDVRRRRYLSHSLRAVQEAVVQGIDVRGYIHWSLLDNFEWIHGFSARFGLFRVDYATGSRSPTSTAGYYRAVIAAANRTKGPGCDT